MPVYFIQSRSIQGGRVTLSGELAHHLGSVLRARSGETVYLVDESRIRYRALLEQITKNKILGKIVQREESVLRPGPVITLAQAVLKGDKMTWVIQKATELGVDSILPVVTERTIARPRDEREVRQRDRWQKIAAEAAQQCGRLEYPNIEKTVSFEELLKNPPEASLKLLPWEGEQEQSLKPVLTDFRVRGHRSSSARDSRDPRPDSIVFLIGPEGGFALHEIEKARAAGWLPVSLGPQILRAETAGAALLAILRYELDSPE
jgi:16S rRNA (uracil1498-N3)-methyltransferase